MGFEPTISGGERPQTYALERGQWDRHLLEYNLQIHRRTEYVIHLLNTKFNEKYKMAGVIVVFHCLCYLVLIILFHRDFATLFGKFLN